MRAEGNNDVVVCAENIFKCQRGECFLVRDKGLPGEATDRIWINQSVLIAEARAQLSRFEHPSRLKNYEVTASKDGQISIELGVYDG